MLKLKRGVADSLEQPGDSSLRLVRDGGRDVVVNERVDFRGEVAERRDEEGTEGEARSASSLWSGSEDAGRNVGPRKRIRDVEDSAVFCYSWQVLAEAQKPSSSQSERARHSSTRFPSLSSLPPSTHPAPRTSIHLHRSTRLQEPTHISASCSSELPHRRPPSPCVRARPLVRSGRLHDPLSKAACISKGWRPKIQRGSRWKGPRRGWSWRSKGWLQEREQEETKGEERWEESKVSSELSSFLFFFFFFKKRTHDLSDPRVKRERESLCGEVELG